MEEEKIEEKQRTEYFLILLGTNNLFENKDMNNLILGKYGVFKDKDNKEKIGYRIYQIKVNNMVNVNFYYKLLLGGDFSDSDFKEVEINRLKTGILSRKSSVKKWLFNGVCGGLENYIKEILEA